MRGYQRYVILFYLYLFIRKGNAPVLSGTPGMLVYTSENVSDNIAAYHNYLRYQLCPRETSAAFSPNIYRRAEWRMGICQNTGVNCYVCWSGWWDTSNFEDSREKKEDYLEDSGRRRAVARFILCLFNLFRKIFVMAGADTVKLFFSVKNKSSYVCWKFRVYTYFVRKIDYASQRRL